MGFEYDFEASVWKHSGKGGWHFVSLPEELSRHIKSGYGNHESGWGRLRIKARIASNEWLTSLWYDSNSGLYLLPLNAAIRQKLHLQIGEIVRPSFLIVQL